MENSPLPGFEIVEEDVPFVKKQGASLSDDEISWIKSLSKQNFYFFAKFVLDYPFETSWLQPHIHKPICDALQDWKTNTRICCVLPRSWLKSTVCSVYYPIWRGVCDPNVRVLIVQNTAPNAEKKLAAIRGQFETNALLRLLFPEVLPDASCVWATKAICLKRTLAHPESTVETAGTRSKTVSRHYDVIIEDDTVAPDFDELGENNLCPSKDDIDLAIGFHKLAYALLVDFSSSQQIIVGTRWFEKDLISWNASHEKSYLRIERACRETNGQSDRDGEVTYPERFPSEVLEDLEEAFGTYLFSCLYLNNPLSSTDMVFQKEWIKHYDTVPRHLICYTLVDPAGGGLQPTAKKKARSDPDFNVVMTVGKDTKQGGLYVLEYDRFRGSPSQLISSIFRQQKRWSSLQVGIEGVQYQATLDHWVKEHMRRTNQFFHVVMLKAVRAKEIRIRALQPLFQAGAVFTRTHHTELHMELEAFPLGAHDDTIDALSMVLQLASLSDLRMKEEDSTELAPNSLEEALHDLDISRKADPNDVISEMLESRNIELEDPINGRFSFSLDFTDKRDAPLSYGVSNVSPQESGIWEESPF